MYKQLKPFDQSKAGKKKGYCLQNTRLGYGIVSKYDNATEAWNHTEQHKDRNVPAGVDIPLFYKYMTGYGNEGHINVRLTNGKVWSDGEIFASIEDYEAKKVPDFIGWGESVNGVRVIEYVPDPPKPQATKMPAVNSSIKLTPGQTRTVFHANTDNKSGDIKVTDDTFVYTVRFVRDYRIGIYTKSGGSKTPTDYKELALYYKDGKIIEGWKVI